MDNVHYLAQDPLRLIKRFAEQIEFTEFELYRVVEMFFDEAPGVLPALQEGIKNGKWEKLRLALESARNDMVILVQADRHERTARGKSRAPTQAANERLEALSDLALTLIRELQMWEIEGRTQGRA